MIKEMKMQIGKEVNYFSGTYRITNCIPFDVSLVNLIKTAESTGKFPAYFWFSKVLKNGEVSKKQGFSAFVFKNGNFVKI